MSEQATPQPLDKRRIVKAFFLAPIIVLCAVFVLSFAWNIIAQDYSHQGDKPLLPLFVFSWFLIIIYTHQLAFGLPMFGILKKRLTTTAIPLAVLGFFVGLICLLSVLLLTDNGQAIFNIRRISLMLLSVGLIGAAIGYAFWRIGIKPVDSK